eukprot:2550852-Lingulodinium_polyedra.AAC.1
MPDCLVQTTGARDGARRVAGVWPCAGRRLPRAPEGYLKGGRPAAVAGCLKAHARGRARRG